MQYEDRDGEPPEDRQAVAREVAGHRDQGDGWARWSGWSRRDKALRVVVVVLVVAYAWWAVSLPSFSSSATVAVLLAGSGAAVLGAVRRRPKDSRAQVKGVRAWLVLALMAGAWQLVAYLQHPRSDHPTLSSLTNALLDSHGARAAALVVWIAVAAELSRR